MADFGLACFTDSIFQVDNIAGTPMFSFPIPTLKKFLVKMLPKMPPMSAGRLQHKSILAHYEKAVDATKTLVASESESYKEKAIDILVRMETLMVFVEEHASFEEEVIYPVFEQLSPGSTAVAHSEHEHETPILDSFLKSVKEALKTLREVNETSFFQVKDLLEPLGEQLHHMHLAMIEHMAGEEKHLFPMTESLQERQPEVFRKIYYHCSHVRELLLPFVLENLSEPERMQYMHNIEYCIRPEDPAQWKYCSDLLKTRLSSSEWEDLCFRLPGLVA
jgi:hypothetical protein